MFSQLKIATKLLIGFGVILLLLAGISALAITSSQRSKDALENVTRLKGDEALEQRVEKRIYEARMHFWIAVNSKDPKDWNLTSETFKVASEATQDLLTRTSEPGRADKMRKLAELVGRYRAVVATMQSSQQQGAKSQDEMTVAEINEALKPILEVIKIEEAMTKQGDELSADYRQAAETTVSQARESANVTQTLFMAAGIAGTLFGALLSFVFARSIAQPIVKLTRVMKELAKGDLTVSPDNVADRDEIGEMVRAVLVFRDAAIEKGRLEEEANRQRQRVEEERGRNELAQRDAIAHERTIVADSVGSGLSKLAAKDLSYRMSSAIPEAYRKLQADFNAAIGQLEAAMTSVAASGGSIRSGSKEISSATDDLSRRTEQQAAGLEEAAETLDQVTAMVRKTAQSTVHAHEVASGVAADHPDHRRHRRDRVPDQSAGAERRGRSRARGRRGPGLRGRRVGSPRSRPAFGGGRQGDQGTHFDLDRASEPGGRPGRRNRQVAGADHDASGRDQQRRRRNRRRRERAGQRDRGSQRDDQPDGSGDAAERSDGPAVDRGQSLAARGG
jgi:methyl-accepting chemotaxis protein